MSEEKKEQTNQEYLQDIVNELLADEVWHELFDLYGLVDRRVHCYCYDHFFTPFL